MALTRITKGVIKPNENYQAGIVTATGLDVNGNGDISGDLNVGGILTYEDVTSIDSVGIITAQSDIHVGGGVSAVGVGTFGGLDINGDIDVDGHTNLDNVSIAGVSTFNDIIRAYGSFVTFQGNSYNAFWEASANALRFVDNANAYFGTTNDLKIYHNGSHSYLDGSSGTGNVVVKTGSNAFVTNSGSFYLKSANNADSLINGIAGGAVNIYFNANKKFETTNTGVSINGTIVAAGIDLSGDIDVDGHTNLDNVNVAGVSTFSGNILPGTDSSHNIGSNSVRFANVYGDALYGVIQNTTHTNITRVGTLSQLAVSGTANPLNITHTSANCVNLNRGGKSIAIDVNYGGSNTHSLINLSSGMDLRFKLGGTDKIVFKSAGHIEPQTDSQINLGSNTVRFANVYADTYYGDGSNLSNITSTTINNNADNRVITGSGTANTLEAEANLTFANSGSDPILTITNSGNPQLRLRTTSTTDNCTIDFGDGDAVNRGRIVYTNTGDNMLFYTNGTSGGEKLKLYSNGRLNLSTQQSITSDTMLHVEAPSGVSSGETNVMFEGNATMGARLNLKNNDTSGSANNQINFVDAGGQSTSSIIGYNTDQTNNYGELVFGTRSAQGSPPAERLRITSGGEVLIGGIRTSNTGFGNKVLISGGTLGLDGNGSNIGMHFHRNSGDTEGYIGIGPWAVTGGTDNDFGFAAKGDLLFGTSSSTWAQKMRVADNGRVKIGTGEPKAQLDVKQQGNSWEDSILIQHDNANTGWNIHAERSGNGLWFGYNSGTDTTLANQNAVQVLHLNGNRTTSLVTYNDSYELTIGGISGGPTLWLRDSGTTGTPRILFGDTSAATKGAIYYSSNNNYMALYTNGTEHIRIDSSGNFSPYTDATRDLGTSSLRWRNVYTTDLQLSNENTGGNEVDGTEGNWTLQEGESDVYMINRKTGKKYKMMLQEVS